MVHTPMMITAHYFREIGRFGNIGQHDLDAVTRLTGVAGATYASLD
jgi:hypothetical protein